MNTGKRIEEVNYSLIFLGKIFKKLSPRFRKSNGIAMVADLKDLALQLAKIREEMETHIVPEVRNIDFHTYMKDSAWNFKPLSDKDSYYYECNPDTVKYMEDRYAYPATDLFENNTVAALDLSTNQVWFGDGFGDRTVECIRECVEEIKELLRSIYEKSYNMDKKQYIAYCQLVAKKRKNKDTITEETPKINLYAPNALICYRTKKIHKFLKSNFFDKLATPSKGAIKNCNLTLNEDHLDNGTVITDQERINLAKCCKFIKQDSKGNLIIDEATIGIYLYHNPDLEGVEAFATFYYLLNITQARIKEEQTNKAVSKTEENTIMVNQHDFFGIIEAFIKELDSNCNGGKFDLGGRLGKTIVKINIDEISQRIDNDKSKKKEIIKRYHHPSSNKGYEYLIFYIKQFKDAQLFGKLSYKELSIQLERVIPLAYTTIQSKFARLKPEDFE